MTPEGRPDTWVELIAWGLGLFGIGGGGGAAIWHKFGGKKVYCEAEKAKKSLQEQLRQHHDAQERALEAIRGSIQQHEVREAATAEQIRMLLQAVSESTQAVRDSTRSVDRLVTQLESDRRARNGGGR